MTPSLDDFLVRPPFGVLPALLVPIGVFFLGSRLARWLRGSASEPLDLAAGFATAAGLLGAACHGLALAGLATPVLLRTIGGAVAVCGAWWTLFRCRDVVKRVKLLNGFMATSGPAVRIAFGLGIVTMAALFSAALGPVTDI